MSESEASVINNQQGADEEEKLELPPGFRFHPTDEEVITHYLIPKVLNYLFTCLVIADVDLNLTEPWHLPSKAKMGEKEWYFFCHKGRKYPTGTRTNRATASGYWKATGRDKEIFRGRGVLVGMKKTLVFYLGRAPQGKKTPWVMHEYRIEGKLPPNLSPAAKDEWSVCRVFNKDLAAKPASPSPAAVLDPSDAFFDDLLLDIDGMPPLVVMDPSPFDGGASSSSSGATAAGMSNSVYHHQVKTENPPPLPLTMQEPHLFTLPGPEVNDVIRRTSRDETGTADIRWPFPEFDDLCPDLDCFLDYSNMWKV